MIVAALPRSRRAPRDRLARNTDARAPSSRSTSELGEHGRETERREVLEVAQIEHRSRAGSVRECPAAQDRWKIDQTLVRVN